MILLVRARSYYDQKKNRSLYNVLVKHAVQVFFFFFLYSMSFLICQEYLFVGLFVHAVLFVTVASTRSLQSLQYSSSSNNNNYKGRKIPRKVS